VELKVYSSEKFERDKIWYIVFSSIFIIIFIISIFYKNIVWIILMFFLLWAYIYYGIINIQEIKIKISDNWLVMWDRIVAWSNIVWYCLEIEPKKQKIKNIVLVNQKWHSIYTINDKQDNIRLFLENIDKIKPILSEFPQSFREKVSRRMKL
jgi:hypothetical protein